MIAIRDSQRRLHPHERTEQVIAPLDNSKVTQDDLSRGLFEQFRRLQQLMQTATERLDSRVDIRLVYYVMDKIRDQLAMYFQTKERCGDFDIALRFHRQASAIAAERTELYVDACDIADDARDLLFLSEISMQQRVDRLIGSFQAFRQRLDSNERREIELILRSVYEDIGVGD